MTTRWLEECSGSGHHVRGAQRQATRLGSRGRHLAHLSHATSERKKTKKNEEERRSPSATKLGKRKQTAKLTIMFTNYLPCFTATQRLKNNCKLNSALSMNLSLQNTLNTCLLTLEQLLEKDCFAYKHFLNINSLQTFP